MTIESVTYVNDLNSSYPDPTDSRSEGDDHIRRIKLGLRNTFPNASRAQYFRRADSKTAGYTILSTDMEKLFSGNASGGAFSFTLPTLASTNDGWFVDIIKTDSSANAITVVGTINGEANMTLTKQYQSYTFFWTGTDWLALPKLRVVAGVATFVDVGILGLLDLSAVTSYMRPPSGTTAQRPGTPAAAHFRHNTTLDMLEWYSADATAWRQAQPALPLAALRSKLVIKVTGNTGLTVTADGIATTDGVSWDWGAYSSTLNLGTTGADALDAGAIASATFYALWAISKPDGTRKVIASTSFTNPTLPSGYTKKAYIGSVRTATGSAQLMGTWQFDADIQYKLGLAQTTALPTIVATGDAAVGNVSTPTWVAKSVSALVSSRATQVRGHIVAQTAGASVGMLAPNNSYGSNLATSGPPPIVVSFASGANGGGNWPFTIFLESTDIYVATNVTGHGIYIDGWKENL